MGFKFYLKLFSADKSKTKFKVQGQITCNELANVKKRARAKHKNTECHLMMNQVGQNFDNCECKYVVRGRCTP